MYGHIFTRITTLNKHNPKLFIPNYKLSQTKAEIRDRMFREATILKENLLHEIDLIVSSMVYNNKKSFLL